MLKEKVERNAVAECVLKLNKQIAFDLVGDFLETSRFVIIDDYDIRGGGIIREAMEDEQSWIRDKVLLRDYKWTKSVIPQDERTVKHSQGSALVFITGNKDIGKKTIAKLLEEELFQENKLVYFLGIGNVLYGVDADIKGTDDAREEHLRRLAEISHLMLDAGMILIVTAVDLTKEDFELMKTAVSPCKIKTIWVGNKVTTDIEYDLKIEKPKEVLKAVELIRESLEEDKIIW